VPKLSAGVNYPEEEPYKCGDYGATCQCPGKIHLGLKYRNDSGAEITAFHEFTDFKKTAKYEGPGYITTAPCVK